MPCCKKSNPFRQFPLSNVCCRVWLPQRHSIELLPAEEAHAAPCYPRTDQTTFSPQEILLSPDQSVEARNMAQKRSALHQSLLAKDGDEDDDDKPKPEGDDSKHVSTSQNTFRRPLGSEEIWAKSQQKSIGGHTTSA